MTLAKPTVKPLVKPTATIAKTDHAAEVKHEQGVENYKPDVKEAKKTVICGTGHVSKQILEETMAKLGRPTDPRLIKTREEGYGRSKVTLKYVTGPVVIDALNDAFNGLWSFEIVNSFVKPSIPKEKTVYDQDSRKATKTGELEEQKPVCHVHVRLKAYLPQEGGGYFEITKDAFGCNSLKGGQSEQENIFKAAATDGLKKAAQNFGIALDLARSEEAQEYYDELNYKTAWTDEEIAKHQNEINYFVDLIDTGKITKEDLDQLVAALTEGVYSVYEELPPENFTEFYTGASNYIKEQLGEK